MWYFWVFKKNNNYFITWSEFYNSIEFLNHKHNIDDKTYLLYK